MATTPKSIMVKNEFPFPEEILVKIISHVPISQWPNLEMVNRMFQRNVNDNWLKVKNIRFDRDLAFDREKLRFDARRVVNSVLAKLINRAPYIRSLGGFTIFQINDGSNIINADFIRLLSRFHFLKSIDLTNIRISYTEMSSFLRTSKIRGRLKNLKLINCLSATNDDHVDQLLRRAFSDISNLPSLQLEKLSFAGLGAGFGFFQTIDISNLTVLKIMDIQCTPIIITFIIRRCHVNLLHLEFSLFLYSHLETPFPNEILLAFDLLTAITTCRNLSILKINKNQRNPTINLNNYMDSLRIRFIDSIQQLNQSCRLEELFLLDDRFSDNDVVAAISTYLPNLAALDIYVDNCNANVLFKLFSIMRRLKKLKLKFMIKDTRRAFIGGDIVRALVKNLHDLEYLHLSNSFSYLENMENDLAHLKKLKSLSFEGDENFYAVLPWIDALGAELELLELKGYNGEKDFINDFISIIKKTPKLRRLRLENCPISDECLKEIASGCPNLEEFDLKFDSTLSNVSISAVQILIDGCPNLKRMLGFGGWFSRDQLNLKYRGMAFD